MPCVRDEKSRQTRCGGRTCSVIYQARGGSVARGSEARGSLLATSQGCSSSGHHTRVQLRLSRRKGPSADSLYYRGWHSPQPPSMVPGETVTNKEGKASAQSAGSASEREAASRSCEEPRGPLTQRTGHKGIFPGPQGDARPDGSTSPVSGLLGISPAERTLASD